MESATVSTPESKKRKMTAVNGDAGPSPKRKQTKTATTKLKNGAASGEDIGMQTPPADAGPKPTEVVNVPPPYQPVRAFEIGDIAKLSILNHHNSRTGILVKIDNHALPYPGMSWQYSIRADSVIPSGQGVLWIDEKNFEKVTPLNVPRGARLDYLRNGVMMHGFITNANSSKDGELLYEVQQVCSANVAAKDVLRVVNFGFGDRDGI